MRESQFAPDNTRPAFSVRRRKGRPSEDGSDAIWMSQDIHWVASSGRKADRPVSYVTSTYEFSGLITGGSAAPSSMYSTRSGDAGSDNHLSDLLLE